MGNREWGGGSWMVDDGSTPSRRPPRRTPSPTPHSPFPAFPIGSDPPRGTPGSPRALPSEVIMKAAELPPPGRVTAPSPSHAPPGHFAGAVRKVVDRMTYPATHP